MTGAPVPFPGGATGAQHTETMGVPFTGVHSNFAQFTDEGNASNVIQHLLAALGGAKDPALRETLSNAMAALHKHVAGLQKERQEALAGKLSPRLLAEAHGHTTPAHLQAAAGDYAGAAQTWINHHPYAVAHGHIPAFVQAWEAAISHAPAPGPTAQ